MKTRKSIKRVFSALICVAILATGINGLIVSAATESSVSFGGYSPDVAATDELFESKFEYYFNSSTDYYDNLRPTDTYTDLDVWVMPKFGAVDGKGSGRTVYDRIGAMSPKDASGNLVSMKNAFVRLSDIRVGDPIDTVDGAIWIGLRQQTPGKFIDGLYEFNKDQIFVRVTNAGITVASGEELAALSGSAANAAVEDYKFDSTTVSYLRKAGNKLKIEVTLINDTVKVYISDPWNADNFPKHNYEEVVSASAPSCGYVSFGIGDTGSYGLYNSTVRKYDDNGNAVDFDSANNPVAVDSIPAVCTVALNSSVETAKLPSTVMVVDKDNCQYSALVEWDTSDFDTSKPGTVTLNGVISSTAALPTEGVVKATAKVTVVDGESKADGRTFNQSLHPFNADAINNNFVASWSHEGNYQSNLPATTFFGNGWNQFTVRTNVGTYPYRTDNQGEYYSRIVGLTPVDQDGNAIDYKNFELTFKYRNQLPTPVNCGAFFVGFRQAEAGHFLTNFATFNTEQSLVRVTNQGISVGSGSSKISATANDVAMSDENAAWMASDGALVTIKVKVVGSYCTVTVSKSATGEVLLTYTEILNTSALQNGYLTFGLGDRDCQMIDLTITELNDVEEYNYAFQPFNAESINKNFVGSWSHEGNYLSNMTPTDLFHNGWNGYTERLYSGNYPYITNNSGETYSRIAGLTPLDQNGKLLELRNFELTFNYRVPITTATNCGAIFIGFRQKEAGHFLQSFANFNAEQALVRVTNGGISIGSSSNKINATANDVAMSEENTAWLASDGALVTIKVKVVGNNCTVTVSNASTGAVVLTHTEQLSATAPQSGYLTLGIGDRQIHMINMAIRSLDEAGNAVDLTAYTKGDANGDNNIDILDYVRIKKYAVNENTTTAICKKNADSDKNGKIDSLDIVALKKILLNIL